MDESEIIQPEYYDIIPEYNSAGRLCNYHTGPGETVRVMADEWERFNMLAGRRHEVVDGVVVYNEALEPCLPDDAEPLSQLDLLQQAVDALILSALEG